MSDSLVFQLFSEIFGRRIMDNLIDYRKQSHDTNNFTEHQILDQCKTKRTEQFFKFCEGYTVNNIGDHLLEMSCSLLMSLVNI